MLCTCCVHVHEHVLSYYMCWGGVGGGGAGNAAARACVRCARRARESERARACRVCVCACVCTCMCACAGRVRMSACVRACVRARCVSVCVSRVRALDTIWSQQTDRRGDERTPSREEMMHGGTSENHKTKAKTHASNLASSLPSGAATRQTYPLPSEQTCANARSAGGGRAQAC